MYAGFQLCLMASLSTLSRSSLAFHTIGDTSLADPFDSALLLKRDGGSISARETIEDDEDDYDPRCEPYLKVDVGCDGIAALGKAGNDPFGCTCTTAYFDAVAECMECSPDLFKSLMNGAKFTEDQMMDMLESRCEEAEEGGKDEENAEECEADNGGSSKSGIPVQTSGGSKASHGTPTTVKSTSVTGSGNEGITKDLHATGIYGDETTLPGHNIGAVVPSIDSTDSDMEDGESSSEMEYETVKPTQNGSPSGAAGNGTETGFDEEVEEGSGSTARVEQMLGTIVMAVFAGVAYFVIV